MGAGCSSLGCSSDGPIGVVPVTARAVDDKRWNLKAGGSSGKYHGTAPGITVSRPISTMDTVETEEVVEITDEDGLMGSLHKGSNKSHVLVEELLDRQESGTSDIEDDGKAEDNPDSR